MPRLSNPKHEAFACLVACGEPKYKAYAQLFKSKSYASQAANASILWNKKGITSNRLQNRVQELIGQRMKANELTRDDMLDMMLAQHELASESGQHSAAIKALELIGKEQFRMYTERREVVTYNIAQMDRNQLEKHIRDRYGDRAQALLDWIAAQQSDSAAPAPAGSCAAGSEATPPTVPKHLQLVYDSDSDA